jgi:serine/threonine-protein kinase
MAVWAAGVAVMGWLCDGRARVGSTQKETFLGDQIIDLSDGQEMFGRIAIKLGYVTEAQLQEALAEQGLALESGFRRKLGSVLVSLGHLNEVQCQVIVSQQNARPVAVRIGGFEILNKLGSGGMGTVYRARQMSLDRIVALKILRRELARDASIRERFLSEARSVARLNHPNIVAGIAVGCEGGQYFFAMEFVAGKALSDELKVHRRGLPERQALEYVRQVALALQHAHNRRLLHRDIKPENILVTDDGQAKLTDLGLARALNRKDDKRITKHGVTVGTPYYLSPEQAQGTERLTRATDLYALGATLYHLLTGKVPYDGKTSLDVMAKHISEEIPDPRVLRPGVSQAASSICMRLMQKRPRDRFPSAISLAEELEQLLQRDSRRQRTYCEEDGEDEFEDAPAGLGYRRVRASTRPGPLEQLVGTIARRLGL